LTGHGFESGSSDPSDPDACTEGSDTSTDAGTHDPDVLEKNC
jgi:hypothetical protein